ASAGSPAELKLVPGGNRGELEEGAVAAGVGVAEVGVVVVPGHLEEALLHAVVEPRAAEDELAQPVDERLAVDERHAPPVPDEVAAEATPRLVDEPAMDELDEIGGLVLVELVALDEPELHGRGRDAALRVGGG